jgi:quinoprotein glucose dehydrogenase
MKALDRIATHPFRTILGAGRPRTLLVGALLVAQPLAAAPRAADTDSRDTPSATSGESWAVTTGDAGSRRYSPLGQIDADNVHQLEPAWRWTSPDEALSKSNPKLGSARMQPGGHQATPLKVGDRIYTTTGYSQAAAIDPDTGETLWVYDPQAYNDGRPTNLGFVHRGPTFWTDGEIERLFYAGGDSRLRALDPKTGKPVDSFGDGGAVDLTLGLRREFPRRKYSVSSPVVMCRDTIVVGSSISDGPTQPEGAPPGDVRGFDARTGAQRWVFHSIPQEGEQGVETWENDSWRYTGNANVWTLMSADEELGLVYLPFGTPTNDWYGGHRLGDNLYAESLVAVDCETGERAWHFQAIHHGLWDYDLVTSPVLGDFTVDGKRVRAAMQLSKQGFVYVFDRATGEPVWPIEERAVPKSNIPGERSSPTQPFPTRPPAYERQGMTHDDLIDFTPELRRAAIEILERYDYGPLYTPPSERGTLNMPGWAGGASWPGGAFDPETGFLYVPSFTSPVVMTLKKPDASRSGFDYIGAIQTDVPGPRGLPLTKPPYSRLTAYDMNRGEIAWMVPIGDGPRRHPDLRELDLPALGSGARSHVLVTRTLLFVTTGEGLYGDDEAEAASLDLTDEAIDQLGAPDADAGRQEESLDDWRQEPSTLRALDKRTGETVWQMQIDAHTDGSPMTFLHDGEQYVVFALGGRGEPAELMALKLAGND